MEIKTAVLVKYLAFTGPRFGEGWPRPGLEQQADDLLRTAGVNDLGRTAEGEKAVADFYQQQSDLRAAAAQSAADARAARLVAAAAAAKGDIVAFVQATDGLKVTMDELTGLLGVTRFSVLAKRRDGVDVSLSGIVCWMPPRRQGRR